MRIGAKQGEGWGIVGVRGGYIRVRNSMMISWV